MADVRLTAINPVDSSAVPVACNAKGELLLEAPPTFDGSFDGDLDVTGQGSFKGGNVVVGNTQVEPSIFLFNGTTGNTLQDGFSLMLSGLDAYFNNRENGDLIFYCNGSEHGRFTAGGKFLVGTGSSRVVGSAYERGVQIEGTSYSDASLSVTANGSSVQPSITLARSKASAVGGSDAVQIYDPLGLISWVGADGTGLQNYAAWIACDVPANPGTQNVPGRLSFAVTPPGPPASPSARLTIESATSTFETELVITSRGERWTLVESGGLCHLVADTVTADLAQGELAGEQAKERPPLRDIPAELTMVEQQLQAVMEKLRMAPEAGWEVWDGSD